MLEAFDAVHALNAVCGRRRLSAHGTAGRSQGDREHRVDRRGLPSSDRGALRLCNGRPVNLTKVHAYEVGRHRIRANGIAPGVVDTKLTAPLLATTEQRVDRVPLYPVNRVGLPEDAAAAAVHLCSDETEWVSGNVLYVTGGQVATSDAFRWARAHNPVPESAGI